MRKLNLFTILIVLVALASFAAAFKWGGGTTYGFYDGR